MCIFSVISQKLANQGMMMSKHDAHTFLRWSIIMIYSALHVQAIVLEHSPLIWPFYFRLLLCPSFLCVCVREFFRSSAIPSIRCSIGLSKELQCSQHPSRLPQTHCKSRLKSLKRKWMKWRRLLQSSRYWNCTLMLVEAASELIAYSYCCPGPSRSFFAKSVCVDVFRFHLLGRKEQALSRPSLWQKATKICAFLIKKISWKCRSVTWNVTSSIPCLSLRQVDWSLNMTTINTALHKIRLDSEVEWEHCQQSGTTQEKTSSCSSSISRMTLSFCSTSQIRHLCPTLVEAFRKGCSLQEMHGGSWAHY